MSLYSEDMKFPRSIYDPETGEEVAHSITGKQDMYLAEAVQRGEDLERLVKSPGFKFVREWLNDTITNYKESLVWAEGKDKIHRMQEAVKCYENILQFIDNCIREGQELKQQQRDNSTEK